MDDGKFCFKGMASLMTSTLGTSPWLVTLYNMPNLILRTKKSLSTSTALGMQLGYNENTQDYLKSFYEMENSIRGNLILSHVFSRSIRSHFQVNAMYFKK